MKFLGTMILIILATILIAYSCSSVERGSVTKKLSDSEAQIYMDENEVKVGDKVMTFQYDCSQKMYTVSQCPKVKVGEGTVVRLLDESTAVVEFAKGSIIKEGTFADKI